jgi:hypothetical protein
MIIPNVSNHKKSRATSQSKASMLSEKYCTLDNIKAQKSGPIKATKANINNAR